MVSGDSLVAKPPNILITGATGAIGTAIMQQLNEKRSLDQVTVFIRDSKKNLKWLKKFPNATAVFGDITNSDQVNNVCKDKDVIIHLAAVIPPFSEENIELGYKINQGGTENVVKAMESVCPDAHLLFSSSVVVYGDRLKNPMISVNDKLAKDQHDHYGLAKIKCEQLIQQSSINWSVFRLTAIMGIGNHTPDGIMFDVPLDTPIEIATVRDTARAFVNALEHLDQLNHKTFNLGGGENCRISYLDFMSRSFEIYGMGPVNFPKMAFAKQNFHCGYFTDGDELDDILQFRTDDLESYFDRLKKSVNPLQRMATRPFAWAIKKYLLSLSKPYKAFKTKDKEKMNFYFGKS